MQENSQSVDQQAMRNVVPTAIWTVVWLATVALARFGPEMLWASDPVLSWIAVALNVASGIGWIIVHARYLRRVDDLQRKILLDAMAVALGVGLVGGFAYAVADNAGLIAFDNSIAFVSVVMGVVYAVASVVGTLRYR
jgi:hypothetical protein